MSRPLLMISKYFLNINDYQLLNPVGEGSHSTVYRVQKKKTGKIFAAKIFRDEIDTEEQKMRFLREITIQQNIKYPSIYKFFGFSLEDFNKEKHVVIFSEYAANGTLEDIIQKERNGKGLPEWTFTKKLINIFGIASAMKYLHSLNIIHRDLKPSNVLEDDDYYPKICDFGFSIQRSNLESIQNSILSITPYYVAPELLNENTYSNKCDVFSFAMTVYSILTSELPHLEKTKMGSSFIYIRGIIDGKRPLIPPNIPSPYVHLIEDCWRSDPNDRPSFDEIVSDLLNNPEYITDEVDKEEFDDYVDFIESKNPPTLEEKSSKNPEKDFDEDVKVEKVELKPFVLNVKNVDLKNFRKEEKIGSGLCGDVFKVIDVKTREIYAAKVMKDVILEDNKNSNNAIHLSREVTILSQISHPSIMKFFGYSATDFINMCRPVILTEYIKNRSLEDIIEIERKGINISFWNDTMKLINIYGIAASMAYLHSKDIIHRDLKPGNVLVDDYLFPKLADFGFSKFLHQISIHDDEKVRKIQSDLMGTDGFIAPEIWEDISYSKKSDVYAFAMLVYEIITKQFPFHGKNNCQIMNCVVNKKERPKFDNSVPEHYKNLIKKCWSQNSDKRPTFESIVNQLETDQNFITKTINKTAYFNYIQFVKSIQKKSSFIDSFQKYSIEPIFIQLHSNYRSFELSDGFIDIDEYTKQSEIYQNNISSFFEVSDKKTGEFYLAEISRFDNDFLNEKEKIELFQEVKVLSSLKHPSIQKVVGFSPVNFKHHHKSVIIREFSKNQTLFDLLEKERENKNQRKSLFSNTKKLINIFGIASGMSYLHSNNVLHHELKTKNILVDDHLRPKITEFGNFIKPQNSNKIKSESHNQNDVIPYHVSPEILQLKEPSKASDVYSFAFVVYEILTSEVPFKNVKNYLNFFNDVVKKSIRPKIGDEIPLVYKNLISSCWEQNPNLRPNFDSIVNDLKNNEQFITKEIDKKEFHDYIKFIEKK